MFTAVAVTGYVYIIYVCSYVINKPTWIHGHEFVNSRYVQRLMYFLHVFTYAINDKAFKRENFHDLLGSLIMLGKLLHFSTENNYSLPPVEELTKLHLDKENVVC